MLAKLVFVLLFVGQLSADLFSGRECNNNFDCIDLDLDVCDVSGKCRARRVYCGTDSDCDDGDVCEFVRIPVGIVGSHLRCRAKHLQRIIA